MIFCEVFIGIVMNSIEISCPAKTFVLGEYGVLDGGPAILINSAPRFSCRISRNSGSSASFDFPEKSPVGQWFRKNQDIFRNISLNWFDPYKGKGGLGFSSAQFNILYAYSFLRKKGPLDQVKPLDLWKTYCSLEFEGQAPSGADILSQWIGGVCLFEQNPLTVQSITSSLPDLECVMIHTGVRIKTHEHLKQLKLPVLSELTGLARVGVEAMEQGREGDFIQIVNKYGEVLNQMGFALPEVQKTVQELKSLPETQAVKGCGALSAEVIILFYKKEDGESLKSKISHLDIVSDSLKLTYGIEAHEQSSSKVQSL